MFLYSPINKFSVDDVNYDPNNICLILTNTPRARLIALKTFLLNNILSKKLEHTSKEYIHR